MCDTRYPCSDSGTMVMVKQNQHGKAKCGCCGVLVRVATDPNDPNKIPRYATHGTPAARRAQRLIEDQEHMDAVRASDEYWAKVRNTPSPETP